MWYVTQVKSGFWGRSRKNILRGIHSSLLKNTLQQFDLEQSQSNWSGRFDHTRIYTGPSDKIFKLLGFCVARNLEHPLRTVFEFR